jgi:hypothetical protein
MIIYALFDSGQTEIVRYIGKTSAVRQGARLRAHIAEARRGGRTRKANWIRSVLADGRSVESRIIAHANGEAAANELERHHIALLRGQSASLTNLTDGGEGAAGVTRGPLPDHVRRAIGEANRRRGRQSDEVQAKRSASLRGHVVAEATRRAISAAKKGVVDAAARARLLAFRCPAAFRGKSHSDETRRRISDRLRGRTLPIETRLKMRVAQLARRAAERKRVA